MVHSKVRTVTYSREEVEAIIRSAANVASDAKVAFDWRSIHGDIVLKCVTIVEEEKESQ